MCEIYAKICIVYHHSCSWYVEFMLHNVCDEIFHFFHRVLCRTSARVRCTERRRDIICEIFDNIVLLWQKFHQTERENSSKSCRTNWKCCKIIGEEIHLRCSPKTTHAMFKSTAFLIEQREEIIALWHSLSHARTTRREKRSANLKSINQPPKSFLTFHKCSLCWIELYEN